MHERFRQFLGEMGGIADSLDTIQILLSHARLRVRWLIMAHVEFSPNHVRNQDAEGLCCPLLLEGPAK